MEVGSVSSGANAAASTQVRARPPEQEQPSQEVQKASNERAQAEASAAESARSEAEKNRPSVNTSGQTVGHRVNTTA